MPVLLILILRNSFDVFSLFLRRKYGLSIQRKDLASTQYYLGDSCIEELGEFKRPFVESERISLVDHYLDSKGQRRIKGNSNLKGSQSYPVPFLSSWFDFSLRKTCERMKRFDVSL